MPDDRLDYRIERQRHEGFVGRTALLAELDRLLVEGDVDRWVVVIGGPGMGKSAILARWLARREEAGTIVPHHFIRRGLYGWDEPATIVRSLAAQIEARYPALRDPDARPESRLSDLLARVSAHELVPRGDRLVLLVDGLDEYDAPAGAYDPLAAFLPHALPHGVRVLCASRPRHPYIDALEPRGVLTHLDLDAVSASDDNAATVRAFWDREAEALGFDDRFVEEAAAAAGGNLQHAAMLRKHLAGIPPAQRRVVAIPRGLRSLLTMWWRRVAHDAVAVHGLGILCAAREPLSLDELAAVAGWDAVAPREAFVHSARELLVETRREDSLAEYRLHHDSIRAHVAEQIGPEAVRGYHAALAHKLATWPAPPGAFARRYALRHALTHRAQAGAWSAVGELARDLGFLEAKCHELGVHDVEVEVARSAERCRTHGDQAVARDLADLLRALARESHWLRDDAAALAGQLWNRLRRMGWGAQQLHDRLRLPSGAPEFVRVRHTASRESPALLRDLVGHTAGVSACLVAPDGGRAVSASFDKTLKLWDLETGRALMTLEGHSSWITSCAVTRNGRHIVSASYDKTVKIWDISTGRVLRTLEGHTGWVRSCAVTPDDRRVISASDDKTLKVWDLATGALLATFEGHSRQATSCSVTPDGRRVISASGDRTLKVWDLATGQALTTLEGHTALVSSCAVAPDGRRAISASDDGTLKIWDLASGRVLATLEGNSWGAASCVVTPDGRRMICASDRIPKIWDLDTGRVVATLQGHSGWVRCCAVSPDGRRMVSASDDKTLKVWDLDLGLIATTPEGHSEGVKSCVVSPDGQRMVSASSDETLKIWDVDTGRALATLEGHSDWVWSCAISPDGRRMVSASDDATLKVWDLDTGDVVTTLRGHIGRVRSCTITPDGRWLISVSHDMTLKIWDFETHRVLATLEGHSWTATSCVVTPGGLCIISASRNVLKLRDLMAGNVLATFKGHSARVCSCTTTPDGRRMISASQDKTIKVWDLNTGDLLATLEGHTGAVVNCAVVPGGQRAVSVSDDRTLRIWDLASYKCLAIHRGDTGFAAVAVTPTVICAGDVAGTLWFLDWPPSLALLPRANEPRLAPHTSDFEMPAARKARPRRQRHLILFLAANPRGTSQLALDQECAAIKRELSMAAHRNDFEFRSEWAVTVDEMARHLIQWQPAIIHFSGHGARGEDRLFDPPAAARDIAVPGSCTGGGGIWLQDEHGSSQLVSARALAMMIKSAAASARVAVLNACYSDVQADALLGVVDCVVGMAGAIGNDAARSFAAAFYRALGDRRSIGNAVEHAVAVLAAKRLAGERLPCCRTRDRIDADQIVLGAPPDPRSG